MAESEEGNEETGKFLQLFKVMKGLADEVTRKGYMEDRVHKKTWHWTYQ